jgi:alpha-glucuronidase
MNMRLAFIIEFYTFIPSTYRMYRFSLILIMLTCSLTVSAETGYLAWLRYKPVENTELASDYRRFCSNIYIYGKSEILNSSVNELTIGISDMLGIKPLISEKIIEPGIILSTVDKVPGRIYKFTSDQKKALSNDGFIILNTGNYLIITAKNDAGILYGTFHLLRLMQLNQSLADLVITDNPRIKLRLLNHWDNPGKLPLGVPSVERGYAGESIFKWEQLPEIDDRYEDYSRILSSVGINGTVVNNVNTSKNRLEGWKLLTPEYLPKLKSLASVFRKYGIKLYISVSFFSPVLIAELQSADPLNEDVQRWWKNKVSEIFSEIPDFGGFLVKADSEGEPGPMKYGRNHADGANLLANALKPFGGILFWRAFVYAKDKNLSPDRAFQAYQVFKPLDGSFADNALVQIKNGPIDFQVREPVSPLFGAMPQTNQMLELQITQEYTGHAKHVCYLVSQWKEILSFDTYASGTNSTVASIVDGSLFKYKLSGIAGVSNIGSDLNWTGHPLAQANLYGFGRLAWDHTLTTAQITSEWIGQTFGNEQKVISVIGDILMTSWKTYEDYTSPLGTGLMCNGGSTGDEGHFTPAPSKRTDYHMADHQGAGYDRTLTTGSGFTGQYYKPVSEMYDDPAKCPEEYLLFFHHLPYNYVLKSGKTILSHIYDTHNDGVEQVNRYLKEWESLEGLVDNDLYKDVYVRLRQQVNYAAEWRDSINLYFKKLSN